MSEAHAVEPAPPLSRALAFVIDLALTVAATGAISITIIVAAFRTITGSPNDSLGFWVGVSALALVPLGSAVLNISLEARNGSSLGKRMLGLRVVDAITGGHATVRALIVRTLLLVAPLLVQGALALVPDSAIGIPLGIVVGLGSQWLAIGVWSVMLLVLITTGRAPLHDRVAATRVVRREPAVVARP